MQPLRKGGNGRLDLGDVLVFQALQFTKVDYGIDMTKAIKKTVRDVH